MENQAFIELVRTAIEKTIAQGQQSRSGSKCLYNGPEGRCCIVGHMMPDEETRKRADATLGGTGISYLAKNIEWVRQFTVNQINFLNRMQHIHDNGIARGDVDAEDLKAWRVLFKQELTRYIKETV